MGFIAFIILGLISGAIVKAILPGRVNGGWFTTLILGVLGAVLGGWIGNLLFNKGELDFWNLGSWVLAIGGGVIVALIWGMFTTNRDRV